MLLKWDQQLGADETESVVRDLALVHASRVRDDELRGHLLRCIDEDDVLGLCGTKLSYSTLAFDEVYSASQVIALYSKRQDIDLSIDRESVAYEKFCASERLCEETNLIFRLWSAGKFQFPPRVESILHAAQRKIARVLGDVPSFSDLRMRFGPGATTQVTKRTASARSKLGQTFCCSEDLVPILSDLLEEVPSWVFGFESDDLQTAIVSVELHHGKLSFVPKNARTDRSIVVEPALNSLLQLGIGDYMADRLRIFGLDISDQTRNQQLARLGSIDGSLATLDLSSASDCIARELVAHLLPVEWFTLLDRARTSCISYRGSTMKLHKFSSMGNGFTFPLETLIFWALAVSAAQTQSDTGEVSVYGDDIIVPVGCVPALIQALNATGFLVNTEKSFWSGPFRESCGKDYHSGIDVRPVFLKDGLSGPSIFTMRNYFVRVGDLESSSILEAIIPPHLKLWGPDGYGDGHLITDDPTLWQRRIRAGDGWEGFVFDTFTLRSRKSFKPYPGDYVYPSYAIYLSEVGHNPRSEMLSAVLARLGRHRFIEIYGEATLSQVLSWIDNLDSSKVPYDKRSDSFGVTLPGVSGYKRISIYTLRR